MNNLSHEVFKFYVEVLLMLRDPKVKNTNQKDQDFEIMSKIKTGIDEFVEVVILWRVHQVLAEHFAHMLPSHILAAFKKSILINLRIVEEKRRAIKWIDLEKFMDHSIILYLRFNTLQSSHPLHQIYLSCTLFSVDYLEFD